MKALATWSPAPYLNVTAVEREESRWLVTVCSRERACRIPARSNRCVPALDGAQSFLARRDRLRCRAQKYGRKTVSRFH